MFIGHFAVGLAMKRVAPRTSLGTATAAAQWLDLIWPVLLLIGWERVRIVPGDTAFTPLEFESYPISHSLVMAVVWGVLFGLAYVLVTHRRAAAAWLGTAVVSHWVLDWITHRPDLPIVPGGPKVGLGLWNSVAATILVEATIFAAGIWIYVRATRPRDRTGRISFWLYVATLAAIYVANIAGPPPPGVRPIAIAGLGMWLFVWWAASIDRHRLSRD